ncbi:hypothetical protein ENBRE01_1956 [Enteropsectra breve]|nr:hypothetical protein ENBRE01_1956 [Enteropsectra breve]
MGAFGGKTNFKYESEKGSAPGCSNEDSCITGLIDVCSIEENNDKIAVKNNMNNEDRPFAEAVSFLHFEDAQASDCLPELFNKRLNDGACDSDKAIMIQDVINQISANSREDIDIPSSIYSKKYIEAIESGEKVNLINKKIELYKTEMCRSYSETGFCRYASACQFSHSELELRKIKRHPKYKTVICRTFWNEGSCPYGKRCCFTHLENIDRPENAHDKKRALQENTVSSSENKTINDVCHSTAKKTIADAEDIKFNILDESHNSCEAKIVLQTINNLSLNKQQDDFSCSITPGDRTSKYNLDKILEPRKYQIHNYLLEEIVRECATKNKMPFFKELYREGRAIEAISNKSFEYNKKEDVKYEKFSQQKLTRNQQRYSENSMYFLNNIY